GRIQQPVKLPPAGSHPLRHRTLGDALCFHRLFQLLGDDLLDRSFFACPKRSLFGKEFVERFFAQACFLLHHHVTSRLRFSASSTSCCGVFCVFLMKPCKRIIWPSPMQKITRAIRLLSRSLRTSHKPCPSGAQCGRPIGQPNSTF